MDQKDAKHSHTTVELEQFLRGLSEERRTFHTPDEQVLKADIVSIRRESGHIVALGGIKRLWRQPACFFVVSSLAQRRGFGSAIVREIIDHARGRHAFLFAVVLQGNAGSLRLCTSLGFRPCLIAHKYHFLYLPLNFWGQLTYPLYYLFFPPAYLGFYFLRGLLTRERQRLETSRRTGTNASEAEHSERRPGRGKDKDCHE
jgi:GNAT superfamily N-acetyltransferase